MIFALLLLIILIVIVPFFRNNYVIILLTFLYIPGEILFPEWLFQGMEKMKYIAMLNLIAKILFTVLVFVVIKDKSDYFFNQSLLLLVTLLQELFRFISFLEISSINVLAILKRK